MNKTKVFILTTIASVMASAPAMAAIDVSAEATAFQTDFSSSCCCNWCCIFSCWFWRYCVEMGSRHVVQLMFTADDVFIIVGLMALFILFDS